MEGLALDFAEYEYAEVDGLEDAPVKAEFSSKIVGGETAYPYKGGQQVKKPSVSLRSFFPQTWLFTLEVPGNAPSLER